MLNINTIPIHTETATIQIDLPIRFADDHAERDLPTGTEIKRTKRLVTFEVTPDELKEWRSDAAHYSDCAGQGWAMDNAIGLQNSARATVKRIHEVFLTYLIDRPIADESADRVFVYLPSTPQA